MFKMITWPQYLGTVALLLVLYYAYVALVYYRAELSGLISGKGKAVGGQASPIATPTSLLNRGPLIPKVAVVLPVPAATPAATEEAAPNTEAATEELEEENVAEVSAQAPSEATEEAKQEAIEGLNQKCENDFNNIQNYDIVKSVKSIETGSDLSYPVAQDGVEETAEEFEDNFTVGVAQLSNIFDRAADGKLTKEQIEREVPELENTDVLMAFFKNSSKSAQQLTATLYAEPALN